MFSAFRHSRHDRKRFNSTRPRPQYRVPGQRALRVERLEDRRLLASSQGICHAIRGADCTLPPDDSMKPNSLPAANIAEVRVDPATRSSKPAESVTEGQNNAARDQYFANESNVLGGVSVAAGDVNGDGAADAICGAASGAATEAVGEPAAQVSAAELSFQTEAPIVCQALFQRLTPNAPQLPLYVGERLEIYFDPSDRIGPAPLAPAFPPFPGFTGGVSVATGDLNDDGLADVLTATGTGAAGQVDDLKDQGTSSVFFNPAQANAENGNAATGAGNVQIQASLSSGGLKRIGELLHDIGVLQKAKDEHGFFSDPMGGKRKSLQDQIDRKFAEIDRIRNGK